MHIGDGILPFEVALGTAVASTALAGTLLARLQPEQIPRVALCTSFFFVASLIHIPLPPTSFHLMLIGLVGIVMGVWTFLPIAFGLLLQALLFKHGGLSSLGANALIMGLPAYAAWGIFHLGRRCSSPTGPLVFGFLAGWLAVLFALGLLKLTLDAAGPEFSEVAWVAFIGHQPLAVAEGAVTAFAASLLQKVEPRILMEAGHA